MASLLSSQSLQLDIAVFCVKVLIICFQKHLKNTTLNFKTMKWFKTEKDIMLKKNTRTTVTTVTLSSRLSFELGPLQENYVTIQDPC